MAFHHLVSKFRLRNYMLVDSSGHHAFYTFAPLILYDFSSLNTRPLNYYQQVCHCPMEKHLPSLQIYVLYHQGYNLRVCKSSHLPNSESVCHRNLQLSRLRGRGKHFLVAYSFQRFQQQVQPLLRRTRFGLNLQFHHSHSPNLSTMHYQYCRDWDCSHAGRTRRSFPGSLLASQAGLQRGT